MVDNFKAAIARFDKTRFEKSKKAGTTAGYLIAFSFGKGAVQEVARLKNEEGIVVELVSVEDIVPLAQKPKVSITWEDLGLDKKEKRVLQFKAIGESESGIEFYSWDWNYDSERGFQGSGSI